MHVIADTDTEKKKKTILELFFVADADTAVLGSLEGGRIYHADIFVWT